MEIQSIKQRFGIIGNNHQLNHAIEIALRVANTDLSVLVNGESGVGKEFFPQIIHSYSARKHKNYIAVNCGAIPEGTIDSELFGHEKGSFTGATESRKGYFEMADGGTIFLDEVAELPQTTQVRLLRVLQTGEFIRVGSSKVLKTDVRVVAATNVNLIEAIKRGKFREDLYYRLNIVPIYMPPLRDRKGDIALLFRKFCVDVASQYSMPVIKLDEGAMELLESYRWPGNVRQLKNVAQQLSVIEQIREVNRVVLEKYLPNNYNSAPPMLMESANSSSDSFSSEREILYKVLFDMKSDIRELREMVEQLKSERTNSSSVARPSIGSENLPIALPVHQNDDFDPVEEIEDGDLTPKERYQKELILKTLKKYNGKRKDAAKELFLSERTLYRRIKELKIDE